MNDLLKVVFFGAAAYATYQTGKALVTKLDEIDRVGLTLASGVTAVSLGVMFMNRLEETADRAKELKA